MNTQTSVRLALFAAALALNLWVATHPTAQAAMARPFPQHVAYTVGTIRPNHITQAQLDAATANFYRDWSARYLKQGCGAGRYYVDVAGSGGDANANPLTVSEAHGYGMLILVWLAGSDPKANTYFDGMVRYWKDHRAKSGAGLMAWKQIKGCTNAPAPDNGSTSATVGDLAIGYALLLADKQWGSAETFN